MAKIFNEEQEKILTRAKAATEATEDIREIVSEVTDRCGAVAEKYDLPDDFVREIFVKTFEMSIMMIEFLMSE